MIFVLVLAITHPLCHSEHLSRVQHKISHTIKHIMENYTALIQLYKQHITQLIHDLWESTEPAVVFFRALGLLDQVA